MDAFVKNPLVPQATRKNSPIGMRRLTLPPLNHFTHQLGGTKDACLTAQSGLHHLQPLGGYAERPPINFGAKRRYEKIKTVGDAAADNDTVKVQKVGNASQNLADTTSGHGKRLLRRFAALPSSGRHLFGTADAGIPGGNHGRTGSKLMERPQDGGSGRVLFKTAAGSAAAGIPPRPYNYVPYFSGRAIGTVPQLARQNQSATDTGTKGHHQKTAEPPAGAPLRFTQRNGVDIVDHTHRNAEFGLKPAGQCETIERCKIRGLPDRAVASHETGNPDSQTGHRATPQLPLAHQRSAEINQTRPKNVEPFGNGGLDTLRSDNFTVGADQGAPAVGPPEIDTDHGLLFHGDLTYSVAMASLPKP
jgi:hypothetical protein